MNKNTQKRVYLGSTGSTDHINWLRTLVGCLLALWYVYTPFGEQTLIGLALIAAWILITIIENFGKIKISKRIYCLFIWTMAVVIMQLFNTDNWFWGECKGIFLSVFALETVAYYYTNKKFSELSIVSRVSLLCFIFSLIRILALGGINVDLYRSGNATEWLAGFGIYYTVPFTIFVGISMLLFGKEVFTKIIGGLLGICSLILLIRAQYVISIVLTIIMLCGWLAFWKPVKKIASRLIIMVIVGLLIYVVFSITFAEWLLDYSYTLKSEVLRLRFSEIAYFIMGDYHRASADLMPRIELYTGDIVSFLNDPIFGRRFSRVLFGSQAQIYKSGHNSLFYSFATYGLIPASCLMAYIKLTCDEFMSYWRRIDRRHFSFIVALSLTYIVLTCTNPTFNLYPLTWPLLYVCISRPLNTFERSQKHRKNVLYDGGSI